MEKQNLEADLGLRPSLLGSYSTSETQFLFVQPVNGDNSCQVIMTNIECLFWARYHAKHTFCLTSIFLGRYIYHFKN